MEEGETTFIAPPAASITLTPFPKIVKDSSYSYICSECSSNIQILNVNEILNTITFECRNENMNNNHGKITIPISEYLEKMKNNIFLLNKCSLCNKIQNDFYGIENDSFKYCFECNQVFCQVCINSHNYNYNNHTLINNNEKNTKCKNHILNNTNNDIIGYCLDCECEFCEKCIKSRKHLSHRKASIDEVRPLKEELDTIMIKINQYKDKILEIREKETNKINKIKETFSLKRKKIYDDNKIFIDKIKNEEQKKLVINNKQFQEKKDLLKLKYESDIKELNNTFLSTRKNIIYDYKQKLEINDKNFKLQLDKMQTIFDNIIKSLEKEKNIKSYENLIKLNEIIYNSYDNQKDNFYYNLNVVTLSQDYNEQEKEKENEKKMSKNLPTSDKSFSISISQIKEKGNNKYEEFEILENDIEKEKEAYRRRYSLQVKKVKIKEDSNNQKEKISFYNEEPNIKNESHIKEKYKKDEDNLQQKYLIKERELSLSLYKKSSLFIVYSTVLTEENKIKLFDKTFVTNNKSKCHLIIDGFKKDLIEYYPLKDKNKGSLEVLLVTEKIITNMENMFYGCETLISVLDGTNWNTSKVTNMSGVFYGCKNLSYLEDIAEWDISNVTNLGGMFIDCCSLISLPDISKWNTSKVTNIYCLFYNCRGLKSLPDISKWNISKVNNAKCLFYGCESLESIPDLSKWDVSKISSTEYFFYNCSSLTSVPDLSNWNIFSCIENKNMFTNCAKLDLKKIPCSFKNK